jgi:hypothetical protein
MTAWKSKSKVGDPYLLRMQRPNGRSIWAPIKRTLIRATVYLILTAFGRLMGREAFVSGIMK